MPRKKKRKSHENVSTVKSPEHNRENPEPVYLNRGQYTLTEVNPQFSHPHEPHESYFDWGSPARNFFNVNAVNSAPTYMWTGMEAINAAVPTPAYANYLYQTDYFHPPPGTCPENFAITNTLYGLQFQPIPTFQLYNPGYFVGQNYRLLPGPIFSLETQRLHSLDDCDVVTNSFQDADYSAEFQNNFEDFPNKGLKETDETGETENELPYLVEEPETDKEDT